MNHPNPPIAADIETQWHRRQQQASRATRLRRGPNYRLRKSTGGQSIEIPRGTLRPPQFHPFKIYQFPDAYRKFKVTDAAGTQRFKVHDGYVFVQGGSANFFSYGSDQITEGDYNVFSADYGLTGLTQVPPSDASQWKSDGLFSTWNEVAIPADAVHRIFWLSFSLPIAGGSWGGPPINTRPFGIAVCSINDPMQAKLMFTGETFDATGVWPGFPVAPDPYNIPIGTVVVDDGTLADETPGWPKVYISQYLSTNVTLPGNPWGTQAGADSAISMRDRGTYGAGIKYFVGDVVTITYADATGVTSLYQYIYDPPSSSSYIPYKISGGGPMIGISPNGNSPDPWRLLSKSPSDADYHSGAYDASKKYLRTA